MPDTAREGIPVEFSQNAREADCGPWEGIHRKKVPRAEGIKFGGTRGPESAALGKAGCGRSQLGLAMTKV